MLISGAEKPWLREANEELAQDCAAVRGPQAGLRGSRIHPGDLGALLAVGEGRSAITHMCPWS